MVSQTTSRFQCGFPGLRRLAQIRDIQQHTLLRSTSVVRVPQPVNHLGEILFSVHASPSGGPKQGFGVKESSRSKPDALERDMLASVSEGSCLTRTLLLAQEAVTHFHRVL